MVPRFAHIVVVGGGGIIELVVASELAKAAAAGALVKVTVVDESDGIQSELRAQLKTLGVPLLKGLHVQSITPIEDDLFQPEQPSPVDPAAYRIDFGEDAWLTADALVMVSLQEPSEYGVRRVACGMWLVVTQNYNMSVSECILQGRACAVDVLDYVLGTSSKEY